MFIKNHARDYREMLPGVELKTLTHGDDMLMGEFRLKKGSSIPPHSHHHEQIGYLVKGRIRFTAGDEAFEAEPGDSWCIAGNREHSAEVLEESLIIEVFSPVRDEYLP